MGYTIPEGVDTMLDVVGVGWPNVDEDAYRDMADSLREFADDADDDAGAAYGHIQKLLSTGRSESLTALDKHWSKVQGKHKDLAKAARLVAGALDRVADIIVARKIAAVGELADLCATVGITLAFAPVTAGLSTLLAGAKIAATRIAFKKILKEMAEAAVAEIVATLTEPAVAAIENIVADLAIQTALNAAGVQDGYNTDRTVQAGKDGLQINSAGGPTGPGGGGGPEIDHDAHGKAGTHLANVQISMNGKTKGKLGKAKGHHGRAKGKDSLTAVLDTTIEGVTEKLGKALDDLGDHVGKKVPDAITGGSKTHKGIDKDIDDRIKKITGSGKRDGGDLNGLRAEPGDPTRKRPADTRTRPNSLNAAQLNARANSIPPARRTCETDPVDVATGEMLLSQTDLSLPGVLSLVLRRTHLSAYRYGHWFGRSWASILDERIELDPRGHGALWARDDGTVLVYPALPAPGDLEGVLPLEGDRLPLTHAGAHDDITTYMVTDPQSGLIRRFSGSPYHTSTAYWLNEIQDRHGNGITLHRRSDGSPIGVVHDGGYHVALTVDNGRMRALALRTPDGPVTVTTYGYDRDGNLDAITDSSGLPLRFAYDTDGRIISWTDRNNSTYQYHYDTTGRVVRTVGPDGFLSSAFAYETIPGSDETLTRYADSNGATTTYRVDARFRVVAVTDPLGHTTFVEHDHRDRLLSATDALGHTTRWQWDQRDLLACVSFPDGTTSSAEYDNEGRPVAITTANGAVWRYAFDDRGNPVTVTAADGAVTRYAYEPSGALSSVLAPCGERETYTNDPAGLPLSRTDALGHAASVTRDAFGRPAVATDPVGAATTTEWSVEGLPLVRIHPDGGRESWTYDHEGNCLTHTDPAGGVERFAYTHFDQLVSHVHPDGSSHTFSYDTERRLTGVRGPLGREWAYAYDAAGRLVSETDFDGRTQTYAYDPLGRLLQRVSPLGQTISFRYDEVGRATEKNADGTVTCYVYDRAGRLVGADSPGSSASWRRDALGRVLAETVNGHTVRYTYDAAGRRTSRATPGGTVSLLHYDAAGNRAALVVDDHALGFTHDAAGRELTRTLGGLSLINSWDATGRLIEQRVDSPTGVVTSRGYSYRGDHRITGVSDRLQETHREITLDSVGRPLAVSAGRWSERYAYDAEGNQTAAQWPDGGPGAEARGERTYNGSLLVSAGSVTVVHDAAGRVVERRKKRLSRKPDVWRYAWDAEDRLVACTTPDGVRWTYQYDPLGRRVAKQRHDSTGAIAEEVRFTWDGTRLAEQTDPATSVVLSWEYDGFRPLVQAERRTVTQEDGQEDLDTRFFGVVTDLVGMPTELVTLDGDVAWRSRATVWGGTAWNRSAEAYTPLRFPGQYADPETGLHYNHFRHYDPETARYVTPDPLGLAPAPNHYAYVPDPLTVMDPNGLQPCEDLDPVEITVKWMPGMPKQQFRLKAEALQRLSDSGVLFKAPNPVARDRQITGKYKQQLIKRVFDQYGQNNREFAEQLRSRILSGMNPDHVWELQLGGPDHASNLHILEQFTNQHIGLHQIWPQIKDLPDFTPIRIKIEGPPS
ncbi:RHS repeat-associated core domain-containing protein [Streptomyces sp. NPDC059881]|uniref:RHS repeat-associated core domain-containing protein n=1 Tax=Streptomyces sp. NPDC059881 TaxID=3346986 RepID=UPI0036654095